MPEILVLVRTFHCCDEAREPISKLERKGLTMLKPLHHHSAQRKSEQEHSRNLEAKS